MAIYRLHNKTFELLAKKRENQMRNDLENLSDIEKEILNLFYDGIEKDRYDASDSNGIDLLIENMIIKRKDDKYIEITKYARKYLKVFRSDEATKENVEIGKHNIIAPMNSGGSAQGGSIPR